MIRLSLRAFLVLVGFLPVGNAAALGVNRPTVQPPVIVSAAVDVDENRMIITGYNFGPGAPIIRLGKQVLSVKHYTENRAVVTLPPEMPTATYRLTVTSDGPRKLTSAPFSATVFPVAGR